MGFLNLFKKKSSVNNDVVNNVVEQVSANEATIQTVESGVSDESVVSGVVDNGFADTDPSNVLEKMQQSYAAESEIEAQKEEQANLDSVFDKKINLDESNPMSIFGVDSENNK